MSETFKRQGGNWTDFRHLPGLMEIDFHWAELGPRCGSYQEAMGKVYHAAFSALQTARSRGLQYVLFRHGHSTSRPGAETARSVVRGLMRSKEATPYILRRECVQHPSAFLAAIRGLPPEKKRG